uniref:F-box domain-containing protein n=1 Tax=Globisporangium ultimum (strain ATCC 200006 / CBS 805.95 / DAOM BR144) TaxID=431595 RepID=K3W6U7_GLOUD
MRTRTRRAVATRAAVAHESDEEHIEQSAGKKPKRVEARRVSHSEQEELTQIHHECALIDAVCAAAANEKHAPQRAQRKRARKSRQVESAPHMTAAMEKKQVQRGGRLVLCDVGERLMMSFLPALPGRLKVESVCKRWRQMSLQEVPLQELDFDKVVLRSITKKDVFQILQRSNGQLRRLVLPDMQIDDAIVQCIVSQMHLQFFRAHRLQKKHIFLILQHCKKLESLELLDCQALQLTGWKRDSGAASLQKVHLNGCDYLTNAAAQSLIQMCGRGLKKFILTGTTRESPTLPMLQVLMLDKTKINDNGLKAIMKTAPHLKYLSLQGTNVTDQSIIELEEACMHLRMVRLDSCRSISREMRLKYSERARGIVFSGEMNEYERISMGRKKVELVDDEQSNTESASDSDCDEYSEVA